MGPYVLNATIARVVLDVSVAVFVAAELAVALRWRRRASRVDLRAELVFRIMFLASIAMFAIGIRLAPHAVVGGGVAIFGLGAVIAWMGLVLRWWSFVTLGSYFTTVIKTSADQRVVSRGPYRVLRHPSYTGLLLAFIGAGIMLGNWVGAAASFAALLASLIYRIGREERSMTTALGDTYSDFARSRARLVPFVW